MMVEIETYIMIMKYGRYIVMIDTWIGSLRQSKMAIENSPLIR